MSEWVFQAIMYGSWLAGFIAVGWGIAEERLALGGCALIVALAIPLFVQMNFTSSDAPGLAFLFLLGLLLACAMIGVDVFGRLSRRI